MSDMLEFGHGVTVVSENGQTWHVLRTGRQLQSYGARAQALAYAIGYVQGVADGPNDTRGSRPLFRD